MARDDAAPNAMFKKLSPQEEADYRKWARNNYHADELIDPVWHPAVRDECKKINAEAHRSTNRSDIYIVAEVYGGVLNEISAFDTKEKALACIQKQVESLDFHKDSDDHWTSADEDDDITLWTIKIE